jgi:hypothetical protein
MFSVLESDAFHHPSTPHPVNPVKYSPAALAAVFVIDRQANLYFHIPRPITTPGIPESLRGIGNLG